MKTEIVYLGHDNRIDLILKADGVAVNLGSVTTMTISFGRKLIESINGSTDPILWAKAGYATGEVRLVLGAQEISPGTYYAPLIVYDAGNPNGIVWGIIPISIMTEAEATPSPTKSVSLDAILLAP